MNLPIYSPESNFYSSLGETQESVQAGLNEYGKAIASSEWVDIDANTSLRLGFTQDVYDGAREDERIPTKHADIMKEMDSVYSNTGLVRNVVDLMSDFASRGIRISHPNKTLQRFYRNWFNRVQGKDRSERFLNNLFLYGNVIIRRNWARLSRKDEKDIKRSKAKDSQFEHVKPRSRRIPCRFTFLNPAVINVVGGEIASFTGKKAYCIKLPLSLQNAIANPKNDIEKKLAAELPEDIQKAAKSGGFDCYPLESEDLMVYYYKKQDWQTWAKPIVYSILRQIKLFNKLMLADFAALDSVIDHVRIFKLGSLEHKIMPAEGAFNRLRDMLYANHGAGVRSLVWGPDIEIEESQSRMYEFLGDEKYKPTLSAIYAGLGIPPTLTGTAMTQGSTNNLISIKTLIKRLDYGRAKLVDFWNHELAILQKAMKHREPAVIEFDDTNLGDEEAEKKLFIELADRDIISSEFIQQKFGADKSLEQSRINQEQRDRDKRKRTPKASPFHNPDWEKSVQKGLVDQGRVMPCQVGVEVEECDDGVPPMAVSPQMEEEQPEKDDQTEKVSKRKGRPPNTKDTKPRKRRVFKPVMKAAEFWTADAQSKIAAKLNPVLLSHFSKKNMRSLSSEEINIAEKIKFGVLLNIAPLVEVTDRIIETAVKKPFPENVYQEYLEEVEEVRNCVGRELTFEELRNIQASVYINGVYDKCVT